MCHSCAIGANDGRGDFAQPGSARLRSRCHRVAAPGAAYDPGDLRAPGHGRRQPRDDARAHAGQLRDLSTSMLSGHSACRGAERLAEPEKNAIPARISSDYSDPIPAHCETQEVYPLSTSEERDHLASGRGCISARRGGRSRLLASRRVSPARAVHYQVRAIIVTVVAAVLQAGTGRRRPARGWGWRL